MQKGSSESEISGASTFKQQITIQGFTLAGLYVGDSPDFDTVLNQYEDIHKRISHK